MKKLGLYIMSILTLGFMAACNEDFNEGVFPQTNEPETQQNYDGLVVELGSDFTSALDLSTKKSTDTLYVLTTKETPELNAYSNMNYVLEVSDSDSFSKKVDLEASTGFVLVDELNTAFRELFGISPKAKEMHIRFRAYITEGTARVRCGSYVGAGVVTVTPVPIDLPTIDTAYYLVGDVAGGWDADHLLKLNHSGADVYDDPFFTLTFELPKENAYFKIVPESALAAFAGGDWSGVLGCAEDGSTALEGEIVSANAQAMRIVEKQWVRIKLDMLNQMYYIELLGEVSPYMWVPGSHQNWTPATATQLYSASMNMVYTGHIYLTGGFKVCATPDWNNAYGYDYFTTKSANLTTDNDGNLVVTPGFYYLAVDMTTNSISVVETTWGLVGPATPAEWDPSQYVPMTYDAETQCWTITTDLKAGQMKFCANGSWDINVGGSADKLVAGGDNLNITEAGNYTIKLYLINDDSSYCTITKN
ncbi:MAG: DUF5115 domain-containing protein [Bacteroides sp.]|nr:DUF5115 domain-containing protein [Bacteroides sp.]